MLNGVAPILIFNFPVIPPSLKSILGGIPVVGSSLVANVGLPIPIYLDEQVTGLYIVSETRGIDVQNDTQAKQSAASATVYQKALDNVVTITMQGNRGNLVLTVLLALCDIVFTRIVSNEYGISYLSGSTVIFGGLLKSFNTTTSSENDLITVTMELSKANAAVSAVSTAFAVSPVQGALPLTN